MIANLTPALTLIVGAFFVPLLPGRVRSAFMLLLPVVAFAHLVSLPYGSGGELDLLNMSLVTLRVDKLSMLFAIIFLIATLLGLIYALHVNDRLQHVASLLYGGSAVGAVLAGDLVTLFAFWEIAAVTSVFLVWARRTEEAYRAGMRYLLLQSVSGLLLLAGIILHFHATGSLAFGELSLDNLSGKLIFVAFGIKCAFPLLHNWLPDAYPEATPSGTVLLSAFTTKMAVYALARSFAGTEILIPIGVMMTAFPIFYAVLENDLRRVLSYSMINQIGFMVVGIGVGTELALNGAVAHAFADIIFKGLLFMSVGAVLYRTGTAKCTELGGMYKSMPWTTGFCIVGAASISAFPLFSAFVTKSMIIVAVMEEGYFWTWIMLLFASAGVLHHAGIKIPFCAFFAQDSGKRCQEAPLNMLVAMAIASALCIGIGIFPGPLYSLLPYTVNYEPYTTDHVLTQLQLLMFAVLAFTAMIRHDFHPHEMDTTNLDSDWFYRKPLYWLARTTSRTISHIHGKIGSAASRAVKRMAAKIEYYHGREGILARSLSTGNMAFWITFMLAAYLLLSRL